MAATESSNEFALANAIPKAADDLSPLEQDVLDEYERLAENMKKVGDSRKFLFRLQSDQSKASSTSLCSLLRAHC